MDIMIDLETTGTAAGCCILSIGATTFNTDKTKKSLYLQISHDSCREAGLVDEVETIRWWKEQSKEAYGDAFSGTLPIVSALSMLTEWLHEQGKKSEIKVWGNGAAFDNVILAAAFTKVGLPVPWDFRNDRCYRTLKNIFPYVKMCEFVGTKHNALADAINQAAHAEALLGWSKRFTTAEGPVWQD